MMEAVRTSETSVDNHFTRQYNPEDSSEHHTRRRENLKSHLLHGACQLPSSLTVKDVLESNMDRSMFGHFQDISGKTEEN
jgi:hypothetical protein